MGAPRKTSFWWGMPSSAKAAKGRIMRQKAKMGKVKDFVDMALPPFYFLDRIYPSEILPSTICRSYGVNSAVTDVNLTGQAGLTAPVKQDRRRFHPAEDVI